MARINLEDQFWVDILDLAVKLGDKDKAIGNAVRWFRFSQEAHKEGKLVTEAEFKGNGFSEHLIPVFAERVEAGIQARGASKFFGWLKKKKAAGRKGGKSKSPKKLRNLKQFQGSEANRSKTEASSSSYYSSSSSVSSSTSDSVSEVKARTPKKASAVEGVQGVIGLYCDLWKNKYGDHPDIGGPEAGIVKNLVKDFGIEKAGAYVRSYLEMPDKWFLTKRHDLVTLKTNLNKVKHFMSTGKHVTQKEINQIDAHITNQNTREALRNGEI